MHWDCSKESLTETVRMMESRWGSLKANHSETRLDFHLVTLKVIHSDYLTGSLTGSHLDSHLVTLKVIH